MFRKGGVITPPENGGDETYYYTLVENNGSWALKVEGYSGIGIIAEELVYEDGSGNTDTKTNIQLSYDSTLDAYTTNVSVTSTIVSITALNMGGIPITLIEKQ